MPAVVATARRIVAALAARPPTLGEARLLCVEGPAGSGKTTLAAAVHRLTDSQVIHTDALLEGWDGLPRIGDQLPGLLAPLADGRAGSYRRYDWLHGRFTRTVEVGPRPLIVLEGVGSGSPVTDPWRTLLVWVEVDAEVRDERWLARDGEPMRPHMAPWRAAERTHFTTYDVRARADLVV